MSAATRRLILGAAALGALACGDIASPERTDLYEWRLFVPGVGDGTDTLSSGIPYGCRFMLPADFDTDAYVAQKRASDPTFTIGRMGREIIEAWKNYGAIPMDQTGAGVGLVMGRRARARLVHDARDRDRRERHGPGGCDGGDRRH